MRGTLGLNSSNSFLTVLAIWKTPGMFLSLKNRQTPLRSLVESSTNLSAVTASIVLKSSFSQDLWYFIHLSAVIQRLL